MAKGRPDWSEKGLAQNTSGLYDMAELAARLDSGVVFDRSGKLLFYDDFSRLDDLWTITDNGVANPTALANNILLYGSNSLKADLNVGIGNSVQVTRFFRTFEETQLSYETCVYFTTLPNTFALAFYLYTATTRYQSQILFSGSLGNLYYYDDSGVAQVITTFDTGIFGAAYFSSFKLDLDAENFEYVRFRFNENTYDLSGLGLQPFPGAFQPSVWISLIGYGHAVNALDFYIDRVILTEDI